MTAGVHIFVIDWPIIEQIIELTKYKIKGDVLENGTALQGTKSSFSM